MTNRILPLMFVAIVVVCAQRVVLATHWDQTFEAGSVPNFNDSTAPGANPGGPAAPVGPNDGWTHQISSAFTTPPNQTYNHGNVVNSSLKTSSILPSAGASGIGSYGVANGGNNPSFPWNSQLNGIFPSNPKIGPASTFGGLWSPQWTHGVDSHVDVYVDPTNWHVGQGFDYSISISDQTGAPVRDFIYHAKVDASGVEISVDSNTDFTAKIGTSVDRIDAPGQKTLTIDSAGWYRFETILSSSDGFASGTGTLEADYSVFQWSQNPPPSTTASLDSEPLASWVQTTGDDVTTLGRNNYGWFTFIDLADATTNPNNELAIDNVYVQAPEPTGVALLAGACALTALRRRGRQ